MRHWLALCVFGFAAQAHQADASQFGRDGFSGNPQTNGGSTCTACHAPGAATPTLTITGPATVDAGSTNLYQATLQGGPGVTGGVGVSASDAQGAFMNVNADLAPFGQEISHTMPKAFAGGQVSFSFEWTAPPYNGSVTLYGAGNSTNGLLNLLGDGIATDQLTVNVINGDPPPPPPPTPPPADAMLQQFTTGLTRPVVIRHAGDDRLFIVEQAGRIRIVESDGTLRTQAFLNITANVDDGGNEQGLLGLAFHPNYAGNGLFYVYYTRDPGPGLDRTRISRFSVSGDPDVADGSSEVVLMEFEQPYSNHNGGDIHFGPDNYLYIASGDGGSGGDPQNNGQNPNSPLGKILRIDVDGGGGSPDCNLAGGMNYGVPLDNAFADGSGGAGCDEIWALGLRNPWRMSFDRVTGDMWIADVGQNAREEVNFIPAGTAAGLNLGWRCYEGNQPYNTGGCDGPGDYFNPIHTTRHTDGNCSITGGAVYRGASEPGLYGRYFFSDFCNTSIQTISRTGSGQIVEEAVPAGAVSQPVAFGEDRDGEMYVARLNSPGTIYRIGSNALPCAGAIQTAPYGLWTLISLPCEPGLNNTVADILGDEFGAYGITWVMYEYNESSHSYTQLNAESILIPGRGYWIIQLDGGGDWSMDANDEANPIPLQIVLTPTPAGESRHSLVGNPLQTILDWANTAVTNSSSGQCYDNPSAAAAAGLISNTIQRHNGNAYVPCDDIGSNGECKPSVGEGFWVLANNPAVTPHLWPDGSCVAPRGAAPLERKGTSNNQFSPYNRHSYRDWAVRLRVQSEDYEDPINSLGQKADAGILKDRYDLMELPPFDEPYMTLVFSHPDWPHETAGDYASDYHPVSGTKADEWPFVIHTSEALNELLISWEGPEEILRRSVLIDEDLGVKIKLTKNKRIRSAYLSNWEGRTERRFRWILEKDRPKRKK
jgi:glucose/arabinose dehydrogenase